MRLADRDGWHPYTRGCVCCPYDGVAGHIHIAGSADKNAGLVEDDAALDFRGATRSPSIEGTSAAGAPFAAAPAVLKAVATAILAGVADKDSFELKPDFAESYERYEAFWACEVADRPPVGITLPQSPYAGDADPLLHTASGTARDVVGAEKNATRMGLPTPPADQSEADHRAAWLDIDARVRRLVANLESTQFLGDAMPIAWPNMGPGIFSAWCGAGYTFGATTTWSEPCVEDWEKDGPNCVLDMEHPLFKATVEFGDKLIEAGRGRFIVGLTDFHPGGDHLAALRGTERLAMDLVDCPEQLPPMLERATREYFQAYDLFYDRIGAAGMPATSWLPLVAFGKYYVSSNDFSGLISPSMFERFFLPGIIDECRFLDYSIYHLDGPDALCHLDLLLDIPELNAVQFVPGAGNEDLERWIPLYQRIQTAKKGIQVLDVDLGNIDLIFEHLRPEGLFIKNVGGIKDTQTAELVLERFCTWK